MSNTQPRIKSQGKGNHRAPRPGHQDDFVVKWDGELDIMGCKVSKEQDVDAIMNWIYEYGVWGVVGEEYTEITWVCGHYALEFDVALHTGQSPRRIKMILQLRSEKRGITLRDDTIKDMT